MKNLKKILTAIVVVILLAAGYLFTGGDDADQAPAVSSVSAESSIEISGQDTGVEEQPAETEESAETEEPAEPAEEETPEVTESPEAPETETVTYYFRNKKLLNQHYEKHGIEMGFASAEEYEEAASSVINNPEAMHKTEKEDGDEVYYVEATNEFAVLSTDGYIRTYFLPSAGIKYYNKQ